MLKPAQLDLKELGDRAAIIPGPEPPLQKTLRRIPALDLESEGRIIPVCEPSLGGNELKYVTECLQSNWISSAGRFIPLFERAFAEKCGVRYGVACTSGTTALHLAMASLGIGPGDEVVIPTFTMIATANAVRYTRAKPVLVDAEPRTWNMDPAQIEAKVTPRTRAILPVHTYGHPAAMDTINAIAKGYNLYVVEDAAEAHGAVYLGRRVGSLGDAACFSFYANKIITTGEGGMLVTNNGLLADIARNLRDHAFSTERHFWHKYLGFNYRMTNLQAAIGLAQTERFEALVQARIDHARMYSALLKEVKGLRLPPESPEVQNVFWMYGLLVEEEFGMDRDQLRRRLAARGIETRTFFIPIHLQPTYFGKHGHERYPVAEELCRRGLYLPSAATLTQEDISFVVACIREVQKEA